DLLRGALLSCNNKTEMITLGRVRWLKKTYFSGEKEKKTEERLTPGTLKRYVDQYVIGQEAAKKAVAVAVYRHDKMVKHPGEKFAANVVLLIGPSGCGKTEIMRRIQEVTEYPVICTDVSSLGASQYRGRHKEDLLISLWEKSGRKKAQAEHGIIFMDEFDKVLQPVFSERGINVHDDVQSQLLTMLEGSDVELKVNGRVFTMNTSHILFILAGAFQGIEECVRESKVKEEQQSGFIGFINTLMIEIYLGFSRSNITHEVLMKYGMKRELAGRISEIAVLNPLKREDLIRILTVPKDNLIERYAREIRLACGADLVFTEEALEKIADIAIAEETGARALHQIVRRAVRQCLYEAPGLKGVSSITITGEVVSGEKDPVFCMAKDAADWKAGEWDEEAF
ncbi:MAG: AAA family ATPase, partial [Lachnospiraceae bacterium]|nr:AAA family ATPase [Lachnospiraceae bacterium]